MGGIVRGGSYILLDPQTWKILIRDVRGDRQHRFPNLGKTECMQLGNEYQAVDMYTRTGSSVFDPIKGRQKRTTSALLEAIEGAHGSPDGIDCATTRNETATVS